MDIKVKINVSIQEGNNVSMSLVMGPPEDLTQSPLDTLLKGLEWPYNYSTDGALLPSILLPNQMAVITK